MVKRFLKESITMYNLAERNKIITDHYEYIIITSKKYCNLYKIKNKNDVFDVTQDCFIKIIEGLDSDKYDSEKSNIKTWIDRCIQHHVINFGKKNKPTFDLRDGVVDFDDDEILNKILVSKLLDKLTGVERKIVELRLQGFKSKEIAEKLLLTNDNVKKIFSRLKKRLNKNVT